MLLYVEMWVGPDSWDTEDMRGVWKGGVGKEYA